jgi:hypothetical protein
LRVSGPTTIKTYSLLLPNASNSYTAGKISISNGSVILNHDDKKNSFKNSSIKNVTLSGAYSAIVESTGFVSVPSSAYQYDYVGISLPKRIDLTLKLLDKSGKADFIITRSNATGKYNVPVSIGNMEEIRFHNIGLDLLTDNQTFIMKRPEINATGNITVNNLYIPGNDERDMNLKQLNASLHHSDNYITNYRNASKMQYVTYLNWIQIKGIAEDKHTVVKLPGDISERAKMKGLKVPWQEVMVSKNGIILFSAVVSVTMIALWQLRRLRLNNEVAHS